MQKGELVPTYPYLSGQGALVQTFEQLRRSAPSKVDSGYLKRFSIAPANESYVISILRFLGLIDENGNRIDDKSAYLFGDGEAFKSGLESALREAYSPLFEEMGDAFDAEKQSLSNWFRGADKTSALVGQRQASTFQTLAALAGHGDIPVPAARAAAPKRSAGGSNGSAKGVARKLAPKTNTATLPNPDGSHGEEGTMGKQIGLSVRIEVNLPAGGDAETYDAIFASIKKHLMS